MLRYLNTIKKGRGMLKECHSRLPRRNDAFRVFTCKTKAKHVPDSECILRQKRIQCKRKTGNYWLLIWNCPNYGHVSGKQNSDIFKEGKHEIYLRNDKIKTVFKKILVRGSLLAQLVRARCF